MFGSECRCSATADMHRSRLAQHGCALLMLLHVGHEEEGQALVRDEAGEGREAFAGQMDQ
jgi:hypothetical protein